MPKTTFRKLVYAIVSACIVSGVFAQQVNEPTGGNPEWSKPYDPFRVVGNVYYVGTYALASYLITTPKGHVLINTGLASSYDMIKSNITSLGFRFDDIKILLTNQAHFDHVGAMAAIKKATRASMLVDEKDIPVMADGGVSDYAFGGSVTFAPVKADRELKDHDVVALGGMDITLLHHPGHTKGSCSYIFDVKEGEKTYRVLIANMPSIVTDQPLDAIEAYATIATDYAKTLRDMKALSFDLWLSAHASQFNLHDKRKAGDPYNPEVFRDRKGYDKSLAGLQAAYDRKSGGKQ